MMTLPIVSAALSPAAAEKQVGCPDLQIAEEDVVELGIVILAGMDERWSQY